MKIDPLLKTENDNKTDLLLKKAFWSSLVFMLALLWFAGYDSGYNSDEMDMNIYGKTNIAYYTSGFKDTSFKHPSHHDGSELAPTLPYYGSGFEYFATGLTYILGDDYEYNTRHALNQFIAILGLLFTGLTVLKIKNIRAALLSIWLIYLSPIFFGLSIFDTKDVPFLSAYIACIYFTILFFEQIPQPKWKTALALSFSLWFLLSVRIGGVLMVGFVGLYALVQYLQNKSILHSVKNWGSKLTLSIMIAVTMMVLLWPFVLQNPIDNIIKSINVVKDFPQKITLAFDGDFIDSMTLPKNYLPKMISITLPITILLVMLVGFVSNILFWQTTEKKSALLLLLIAGLFPIIYAIYATTPIYNSWRHLLFIYPPLIAFVSVGFVALIEKTKRNNFQIAIFCLIAIGLIKPTLWCIKNCPYQYAYYNEWAGGYANAYYNFETDYWQISVKEAVDWLMKNEAIAQSKDTQIIATNAYIFCGYYFKKRYPNAKVKCEMTGERTNYRAQGVYSIFNTLFLEPAYLEYCYPSPFSIHTIDIDSKPATYISKDTAKYAYRGFQAFEQTNHNKADSFFNLYQQQIQYDGGFKNLTQLFGLIAYSKFVQNDLETAYNISSKVVINYPEDFLANLTLGALFISAKDYKKAIYFLQVAREVNPNEKSTQFYLDLIPKQY